MSDMTRRHLARITTLIAAGAVVGWAADGPLKAGLASVALGLTAAVYQATTRQERAHRAKDAVEVLLNAQEALLQGWAEAAPPGQHLSARQQELWRRLHEKADNIRAEITQSKESCMPEPKLRRRDRRVLVALLTDTENLSGFPLASLAQVSAARVYRVLDLLENAGHVTGRWGEGPAPRRRFYRLTPDGRDWAHGVLGLTPARVAPEEAR